MQANAKVLLVDEGPDLRPIIEQALGRRPVAILLATSGAQAVEWIERDRPDVVVCDVYMPDIDGYRSCELVRTHPHLRETPVVLMADIVDRAVLARAARVGSNGVVRKPCPADELTSLIGGYLPEPVGESAIDEVGPQLDVMAEPSALLAALMRLRGVSFAALADREGFLLESAGETALDAEAVTALASGLLDSSAGIGRELGQGPQRSMICEFEQGLVLLVGAESSSTLAVVLHDHAALDAVRRCASQIVAGPPRALEMQPVTPVP